MSGAFNTPKKRDKACPRCGSRDWMFLIGSFRTGTATGCSECPRGEPKVTLDFVKHEVRYGK